MKSQILFRLKQRTLPWRFEIAYLPGKSNHAADAASRHPTSSAAMFSSHDIVEQLTVASIHQEAKLSIHDVVEQLTVASINQEASDLISIPWKTIVDETTKDRVLSQLGKAITMGFDGDYPDITQYTRYKDSLYLQDSAIMYCDLVVVPTTLRSALLRSLHSAHQGVSSMMLLAQAITFWPGMSHDIQQTRARCNECNKNAPS